MANPLSFNIKASGFEKTLIKLAGIRLIVQSVFKDKGLRDFLLKSVKDRFAPAGSNPRAQKAPDGSEWARPATITVTTRKINRNRFNQALVDTGALRRSIRIIETRLSDKALTDGRAGIRIGIPSGSKPAIYGAMLNVGGTTPNGRPIPARRFLGIGALEQRQINRKIQQMLNDKVRL